MKVDILAIGVHPDDIELGCSGTLLKHMDLKKSVGLLDLTRGELGTRGSAELRAEEAANAALNMGAAFRKNLSMADGFFQHNEENLLKIIRAIRWCQPEIVLANSIADRHPDHGRAAKLVADACYYSGLGKIETTDERGDLQKKWRPKAIYHYIQDQSLEPDFVVDITPFFDRKIELVQLFTSQFYQANDSGQEQGLQTPISGKDFLQFLGAKARSFGRPIGVQYAEGFVASRTPGIANLLDLL